VPLIDKSDYVPPWYWRNAHLQTILPNRVRRVSQTAYDTERCSAGGAEVELSWSRVGSDTAAIVVHGLGGHVRRPYLLGMVRALNRARYDAVAWPVWGDGDPDREPRFNHGGATDEIRDIVRHLSGQYTRIIIVGFSLGGNVLLKYLGEEGDDTGVSHAVAVSVPCDLLSSAHRLSDPGNWIYLNGFMRTLKQTARRKAHFAPEKASVDGLDAIDNLISFDDRYTAPLNGFEDAKDYYARNSSRFYVDGIRVPTLILNARNDPFLTEQCYPVSACEESQFAYLETPDSGGHVGFPLGSGSYWAEERAVRFLEMGG
jgi:predicted alpha/beta-fold hydrolase